MTCCALKWTRTKYFSLFDYLFLIIDYTQYTQDRKLLEKLSNWVCLWASHPSVPLLTSTDSLHSGTQFLETSPSTNGPWWDMVRGLASSFPAQSPCVDFPSEQKSHSPALSVQWQVSPCCFCLGSERHDSVPFTCHHCVACTVHSYCVSTVMLL